MKTRLNRSIYKTTQDNMMADRALLDGLDDRNTRCFRLYRWPSPGITFAHNKPLPSDLKSKDHAARITGGGIVFHSPGDVLFTLAVSTKDDLFTGTIKSVIYQFVELLQKSISPIGISLTLNASQISNLDYQYCQTYASPFELFVDGHKVCALAVRRYRRMVVIQSIFHMAPTHDCFYDLPSQYHPFFCSGLGLEYSEKVETQLAQVIS